jgi:hypothetical protein
VNTVDTISDAEVLASKIDAVKRRRETPDNDVHMMGAVPMGYTFFVGSYA